MARILDHVAKMLAARMGRPSRQNPRKPPHRAVFSPRGVCNVACRAFRIESGNGKAPAAGCARGGSREKGAPMEAYCVKCKAKREMADPVAGVTKNGKPITKGKCPVCGTTVCRIGKPAE